MPTARKKTSRRARVAPAPLKQAGDALARPARKPQPAKLRQARLKRVPATGIKADAKPPKLKRDSFRMPKEDFELIDRLKARARGLNLPVKKSELLRAGLGALGRMSDEALSLALAAVPRRRAG